MKFVKHHHEHHEHECDCDCCRELKRELHCIHNDLIRILKWIALKKIDFVQIGGCNMNFNLVKGTAGTFKAVLSPADGAQAAGSTPQWTSSNASALLAASTDGLSVDVLFPVGDTTVTSFDLSLSAVSSDPAVGTVSATHTISLSEPTPPPTALQAVDFVQTAG